MKSFCLSEIVVMFLTMHLTIFNTGVVAPETYDNVPNPHFQIQTQGAQETGLGLTFIGERQFTDNPGPYIASKPHTKPLHPDPTPPLHNAAPLPGYETVIRQPTPTRFKGVNLVHTMESNVPKEEESGEGYIAPTPPPIYAYVSQPSQPTSPEAPGTVPLQYDTKRSHGNLNGSNGSGHTSPKSSDANQSPALHLQLRTGIPDHGSLHNYGTDQNSASAPFSGGDLGVDEQGYNTQDSNKPSDLQRIKENMASRKYFAHGCEQFIAFLDHLLSGAYTKKLTEDELKTILQLISKINSIKHKHHDLESHWNHTHSYIKPFLAKNYLKLLYSFSTVFHINLDALLTNVENLLFAYDADETEAYKHLFSLRRNAMRAVICSQTNVILSTLNGGVAPAIPMELARLENFIAHKAFENCPEKLQEILTYNWRVYVSNFKTTGAAERYIPSPECTFFYREPSHPRSYSAPSAAPNINMPTPDFSPSPVHPIQNSHVPPHTRSNSGPNFDPRGGYTSTSSHGAPPQYNNGGWSWP